MYTVKRYIAAILFCMPFTLIGGGGLVDDDGVILLGASLVIPLTVISAVLYVSSLGWDD